MKVFSFKEIVDYTRKNSEFYREYWKSIPEDDYNIEHYPLIDQKLFWDANTIKNNRILTGPISDGIIFKSGGTTGNPKYSVFSIEEWNSFCEIFGKGLRENGLKAGEKVANIFYSGQLYASFLFISKSIEKAGVAVVFPISGGAPIEEIIYFLQQFEIDTLAGVPTSIYKIFEYIKKNKTENIKLTKILFGGESMYQDQRDLVHEILPNCIIKSIGYASVDGGEIGYADLSCESDEHRSFDETTILEIIDDDTGKIINEMNIPGKIYITNLTRRLMPLIRYPVGDRAIWIEPKGINNRKYRLMGRTEEGARIGPMTLYLNDIFKVLGSFKDRITISNFQIVIDHIGLLDKGTLRIVADDPERINKTLTSDIIEKVYDERHLFRDLLKDKLVHPLEIEWITSEDLITNPRTGKLKRVIDNRFMQ